jgi:hypothetical protein
MEGDVSIISDLKTKPGRDMVKGTCAHCSADVYENLWLLDDAYNVWIGRCPSCKALNYLSMNHGLRGYSSGGMHLVLPTDEEKAANNLPADCPSQGSKGPANAHGSPAGELMHQLMNS